MASARAVSFPGGRGQPLSGAREAWLALFDSNGVLQELGDASLLSDGNMVPEQRRFR